jgi:hypothetical protein
VAEYLRTGYAPFRAHEIFEYLMLIAPGYDRARFYENILRKCMYMTPRPTDLMDNYYALTAIVAPILPRVDVNMEKNLIFSPNLRVRASIETHAALARIDWLYMCFPAHVAVCGGYIFSALYVVPTNGKMRPDIDIFLYDVSDADATLIIKQIVRYIENNRPAHVVDKFVHVARSAETITIYDYFGTKWQIILRIYTTLSEIVHSFDVDSCCLAYDGRQILATDRALYALNAGYNTVNFDLLSPSYEWRLTKYATRGMAVYVPNFNRAKVNNDAFKVFGASYARYNDKWLNGIDVLLYNEHKLFNRGKFVRWQNEKRSITYKDFVAQICENVVGVNDYVCPDAYDSGTPIVDIIDGYISRWEWKNNTIDEKLLSLFKKLGVDEDHKYIGNHDSDIDLEYNPSNQNARKISVNEYLLQLEEMGPPGEHDIDTYEFEEESDEDVFEYDYTDLNEEGKAEMREFGRQLRSTRDVVINENTLIPLIDDVNIDEQRPPPIDYFDKRYIDDFLAHMRVPSEFRQIDIEILKRIMFIKINARVNTNKLHIVKWIANISTYLDDLLGSEILDNIISILNNIDDTSVGIPSRIAYKRFRPGEQASSTFNKIVLKDPARWYQGHFYSP